MTLKRRFAERTEALDVPPPPPADQPSVAKQIRKAPATAPGQMLAFQDQLEASNQELELLRERLARFEKSLTVVPIDPKLVAVSRLGNRHAASFDTPEFEALKADIAAAGGNVQPIKVRPLDGEPGKYELVFGHRRHRACLDLGIEVLAIIESVDEQAQFLAMDRENRARADLSPYEQGMHYRRALELGIFPSARQLATTIGVSNATVVKALALADLPEPVIAAFRSPLDLQFRWGGELAKALKEDESGVLSRAREMVERDARPAPVVVKEFLLGIQRPTVEVRTEKLGKNGEITIAHKDGALSVQIKAGVMNTKKLAQLTKVLESFV